MSQNIWNVPPELWRNDLPPGYECTLYVGRMAGRLSPMKTNPNFSEFVFEIHDADDPTEFVLRYHTLEAPAQELARWENVGDTVGIVIAHRGKRMSMVLAYNLTRGKWFGTGYYPHVQDKRPGQEITITESHNLVMLSIPLLCTCIGFILLPIGFYLNAMKSQQYRVLNPTDFRGVTAKRIADWMTSDALRLASTGNPAIDPSL